MLFFNGLWRFKVVWLFPNNRAPPRNRLSASISLEIKISRVLYNFAFLHFLGEGDAYGASLRQTHSRPRANVSLKASSCVDCHVIKLSDLEDVMASYRDQQRQLLDMMDNYDLNEIYETVINIYIYIYACTRPVEISKFVD